MATLDEVMQGLAIFASHGLGQRHALAAEHDEFYVCSLQRHKVVLTEEEKKKLDVLGWMPVGSDGDPEEGEEADAWRIFV